MISTIRNRALGALAALAALALATCAWATPALAEEGAAASFADVPEGAWYVENGTLDFVVSKGVMVGVGDGRFAPQAHLTRAQAATALVNLALTDPVASAAVSLPEPGGATSFSDVDRRSWYAPYVEAALAAGIVSGCGDGTFRPNDPVTRQEAACMLRSYAKGAAGYVEPPVCYPDVLYPDWYTTSWPDDGAVQWCWLRGIIGTRGGAVGDVPVRPCDIATRAEFAQLLENIDGEVEFSRSYKE